MSATEDVLPDDNWRGVDFPSERRLGMRLHAFSNIISGTYYTRTEVPFGVSLPEWRVLQSAIGSPGIVQGEIAMMNGLNVMTVSRAVAGLKRKGLVTSEPDPEDRRRSLVHPTDMGRELGADIAERADRMYGFIFEELSDAEVALVDELLARVTTRFQASELPELPAGTRDWATIIAAHQATPPCPDR